jgi:hypothetical protein
MTAQRVTLFSIGARYRPQMFFLPQPALFEGWGRKNELERGSPGNRTRNLRILVAPSLYGGAMRKRTVAGESIEHLRAALGMLKVRTSNDGMVHLSGSLEPQFGNPLLRAVQRIERELLAQDEAYGDPGVRTSEQRRADAFVLLAERLAGP